MIVLSFSNYLNLQIDFERAIGWMLYFAISSTSDEKMNWLESDSELVLLAYKEPLIHIGNSKG